MKKISTLFAAALLSVSAMATDYTAPLVVEVNGSPIPSGNVQVSVDKQDNGKYTFKLSNFKFGAFGVGNIVVSDVKPTSCGVVTALSADTVMTIAAGDDPSQSWMGPSLGEVSLAMNAQLRGDKLNAFLKIGNVPGMDINVFLGDNADELGQIPNSGFEYFHTATNGTATSDEPNAWHSFMSSMGTFAVAVNGTTHTYTSKETRPGSEGTQSVCVVSGLALGIIPANGTLTTGQMCAGSMSAADPGNNAFTDFTNEAVDGNGDPFYTVLTNMPDSIALWVKFKQGNLDESNKDYKYATVSAIITDGSYYQDPEDKAYTNVVAKAKCADIESHNFAWQRIVVPFDYASYAANKALPKAIQVTISTNAQPGVGSKDKNNLDTLYVDDLSLIYNSKLKSLKFKGKDIEGFDPDVFDYTITSTSAFHVDDFEGEPDGAGASESYEIAVDGTTGNGVVTITVQSNDLRNENVYTVKVNMDASAINDTKVDSADKVVAIYDLAGRNVYNMKAGEVYVVKYANGDTHKVIRK